MLTGGSLAGFLVILRRDLTVSSGPCFRPFLVRVSVLRGTNKSSLRIWEEV